MAAREVVKPKVTNDSATMGAGIQGVASLFGPIGAAVGGVAGGAASSSGDQQQMAGQNVQGTTQEQPVNQIDAAQRALDKENASSEIAKAQENLKNMDPQTQQTYGPILEQALQQQQPNQSAYGQQSTYSSYGKLRLKEQQP